MREYSTIASSKLTTNKFATTTDQKQIINSTTTTRAKLKSGSVWGSHIVKGFSNSNSKKQQQQKTSTTTTTTTVSSKKKPPLTSASSTISKNHCIKRSILGELTCSANNASQVFPTHTTKSFSASSSSRDLFLELDHLRELLRESKERESKLQEELLECKGHRYKLLDLEREVEVKRSEAEDSFRRIGVLEIENKSLSQQFASSSDVQRPKPQQQEEENGKSSSISMSLEMEVLELRRLNKELQLQKRTLSSQLSAAESRLSALENISQSDVVAKVEAETSLLRHTNEYLSKQVECLQMSRLTEVEELVYLRWVNSCLRNELHNSGSDKAAVAALNANLNHWVEREGEPITPCLRLDQSEEETLEFSGGRKLNTVSEFKTWPQVDENCLPNIECPRPILDDDSSNNQLDKSPRRRHSISGVKCCILDSELSKRRQSDGFIFPKEIGNEGELKYDLGCIGGVESPRFFVGRDEINKRSTGLLDVEKRALRIPNPPPRPLSSVPCELKKDDLSSSTAAPPPPPPPPPPPLPPPPQKLSIRNSNNTVQRAPQVVEFYHSLMKRDSRKDSTSGGVCDAQDVANVRSSMIDEIENRSSHLLAIKADVETQGEFVNSLVKEVKGAVYHDIEDVVAFVKWLDDELSFLVDERAVLKHFNWPEKKSDTLREAAFGYRDLKKLESEVFYYEDDPRLPCDTALKKMVTLSEKMERRVYSLLRNRDVLMRHCKEFQIPTDWMLDTGIISKIKFGSVKLAKKYMERVAVELQSKRVSEKDPALEYMLLQGVRFAFRMHQFAGGFDADTMHAFEELRNLAHFSYEK